LDVIPSCSQPVPRHQGGEMVYGEPHSQIYEHPRLSAKSIGMLPSDSAQSERLAPDASGPLEEGGGRSDDGRPCSSSRCLSLSTEYVHLSVCDSVVDSAAERSRNGASGGGSGYSGSHRHTNAPTYSGGSSSSRAGGRWKPTSPSYLDVGGENFGVGGWIP
jgi:hypothetical protein